MTGTLSVGGSGRGTSGSERGSISCDKMTGTLSVGGSGTTGSGSDTGSMS